MVSECDVKYEDISCEVISTDEEIPDESVAQGSAIDSTLAFNVTANKMLMRSFATINNGRGSNEPVSA